MLVRLILVAGLGLATAVAQQPPPADATPSRHTHADIVHLLDKANQGDAVAEFALGQAYADGNGVPQNFDLALKWYRQAADQGNADAENAMGIMYRTGSGVDKSKEEAVTWYRKAARQGSGVAMFNLGTAYYNGDGVDISDATAYAWFMLAKEAGVDSAAQAVARMDGELRPWQINDGLKTIAGMYDKGEGVRQDDAAAALWYRKAAERGDIEAQVKLAAALMAGRGVSRDYGEARKLCEAAAKQKSVAGEVCLGYLYRSGLGMEKNPREAVKHLEIAVQGHSRLAMRTLGEMYASGEMGKVDSSESFLWYLRAAMVGDKQALGAAMKIKGSMAPDDWNRTKKKMRGLGMDPQKVETFLQPAAGQ